MAGFKQRAVDIWHLHSRDGLHTLGLVGRSLVMWTNGKDPWTSGAKLGLMGR